jgi:hypothetical protein
VSVVSQFTLSYSLQLGDALPNSPLLVLLQFLDPNVLFGYMDEKRFTPLYLMVDVADPSVITTHENQLILAKQFIKHGANVNAAVTRPEGMDGETSNAYEEVICRTRN